MSAKNKKILYTTIGLIVIPLTLLACLKLMPYVKGFFYHDAFEQRFSEPVLGVYGLSGDAKEAGAETLQHFTLRWEDKKDWTLLEEITAATSQEQPVLLTIEMFAQKPHYRLRMKSLVEGKYDQKIKKMASDLSELEQTIYVRWNPEMEVPVKRFPWQKQPPELYIAAFRHFAQVWKKAAPDAKIVWGPAGYPGAMEWWPGEDVVDLASVSLASSSELLTSDYPPEKSIPVMLRRKLHRMRFADKPVLVLGFENLPESRFEKQWLKKVSSDVLPYRQALHQQVDQRAQQENSPAIAASLRTYTAAEQEQLLLGVYDPKQRLTHDQEISVEHLFTDWPEIRSGRFRKVFNAVVDRGHKVIVTVEPWENNSKKNDPDVVVNTIHGRYDRELKELYDVVSGTKQTVYLRWAHEMEIPIQRYTWQSQDPIDYIKSYRYFATFRQPLPENIRFVWGPAGDRGSLEWWPGDDVVDYVSVAIYGLPDKNITDHKKQETFSAIFKRKFYRMRFVDKPVFITEFGVKGPEDFQKVWLEEAANTINQYPEVMGVCYFNEPDVPKAWGEIKVPDWSISQATFEHFTEALANRQPVSQLKGKNP